MAGRNRAELEPLIGFFVNTLALRLDFRGDPPFRVLLRQARRVALEAYDHQDLPFERLVSELAPVRDLSRNPIFQTTLALQETPEPTRWPGLEVTYLATPHQTVKFELAVTFAQIGDRLALRMAYAKDLFDSETVGRFVGHLIAMLGSIAADADQPLSQLAIHDAATVAALRGFSLGPQPIETRCVHWLVEDQARRTPDATAVEDGLTVLSYAQLLEQSGRLATRLRELGTRRGTIVALILPRGAALVAAELAVLRSGAAFLPLDVATPQRRIVALLDQARPLALITNDASVAALVSGGLPVLTPDCAGAPVLLGEDGVEPSDVALCDRHQRHDRQAQARRDRAKKPRQPPGLCLPRAGRRPGAARLSQARPSTRPSNSCWARCSTAARSGCPP